MRIAMMTDVYKPHVSGVTNYISLNKEYLEKAGHEVFIFTFGDLDHEDEEERVVRSPGFPLTDSGYYLSFRYNRRAKALLQTMDLVHVHHPFLSGRLALRYCRPLRIPVVFTNHTRYDLYAQAYLPLLPEEFSDTFLKTYMPTFCQAVDLVISPSAGMGEVLKKLGVKAPIEIIPNGVDLQLFRVPCQDCRQDFGFGEEEILLIYVGRLGPEKNLNFLIRAFAGTAEAIKNAHLIISGGGPEEEQLKQLAALTGASDRIHFTGMLPYNELPRYLSMCDIFVTASVTEVHPLSVIEAMATGLPVLGIDSVGVGDTVEDRVTGLLSSQDQATFAALLTRLCMDSDLRRSLGAAAQKASGKYAIEHTTQVMLKRYERLLFEFTPHRRGLGYRIRNLVEKLRT
jgi:1,2-diacylglycerol 3-alpha-glucosyltransferase